MTHHRQLITLFILDGVSPVEISFLESQNLFKNSPKIKNAPEKNFFSRSTLPSFNLVYFITNVLSFLVGYIIANFPCRVNHFRHLSFFIFNTFLIISAELRRISLEYF